MASNVEQLLNALIEGNSVDIVPQSNIEHFLKECVDRVKCNNCPEPKSNIDILLIRLRDQLISGVSSGSGKIEQEKSVNITSNGISEVLPDEGKTLYKVTINTNVASSSNNLPHFIDGSLTSINASDLEGVTSIRQYAFYYCSSITNITLPDSLISIGDSAFYYCEALLELTIPASVTTIGSSALRIGTDANKATIIMKSKTPPTIASNTISSSRLNKIIVPAGCGETYKAATNRANFADYIVEEVA